uniref:Protein FAR1-RELATED SEQUENCE n=1 Tax=Arundo donax TaxID=35708 RepID=A0A0A8ZAW2_ARUDO
MQSNQWSESLNLRLHDHLDRQMSLVDLVEHYEHCLACIRRNELLLDGKCSVSVPFTDLTADLFEKKAARIFTPPIFKKVMEQIRRLAEWEVVEVAGDNGAVRYEVASKSRSNQRGPVACTLDGALMMNVACHCRMLECEGIPWCTDGECCMPLPNARV